MEPTTLFGFAQVTIEFAYIHISSSQISQTKCSFPYWKILIKLIPIPTLPSKTNRCWSIFKFVWKLQKMIKDYFDKNPEGKIGISRGNLTCGSKLVQFSVYPFKWMFIILKLNLMTCVYSLLKARPNIPLLAFHFNDN